MNADGVARFSAAVGAMPGLLSDLEGATPHKVSDHPAVPDAPGIYFFRDDRRPAGRQPDGLLFARLADSTATAGRTPTRTSWATSCCTPTTLRSPALKRPRQGGAVDVVTGASDLARPADGSQFLRWGAATTARHVGVP